MYIYPFRFCMVLVWFWFGFKPYQNHTKTIPKPNQNHTTNSYIWFGFGLVFEAEPASKTNQKRIKNEPKTYKKSMKMASTVLFNRVLIVRKCWYDFWFGFWCWFGFKNQTKPKPNQNIRICGLVLVWFWSDLNLNQNHTQTGGWGFGTEMRAIFLSSGFVQKIIACAYLCSSLPFLIIAHYCW